MPAIDVVDTEPAFAVKLRLLVFDEVRWWTGARWWARPGPDPTYVSPSWTDSEALAEVEDVFETTDALWAARRKESSRVSRLTYIGDCQ